MPDLVQPKQSEAEGALDPAVSTHQLHQTMLKISPSGVRGSLIITVHINDLDATSVRVECGLSRKQFCLLQQASDPVFQYGMHEDENLTDMWLES